MHFYSLQQCARGIVLAAACVSSEARSQMPSPLSTGDRVRVELLPSSTAPRRFEARYVAPRSRSLILARDRADTVELPLREIASLWVAEGKQRPFLRDMLWGAGIGAAAGFLVGLPTRDGQVISDPGGYLVWTASAGAILGTVTGFVVALKPRTHWRRVWPQV